MSSAGAAVVTIAEQRPPRGTRCLVERAESGPFVATPCYGMHAPWWVPLVADLYQPGAMAFEMRDDDRWQEWRRATGEPSGQ
jgi:hypothetical protein